MPSSSLNIIEEHEGSADFGVICKEYADANKLNNAQSLRLNIAKVLNEKKELVSFDAFSKKWMLTKCKDAFKEKTYWLSNKTADDWIISANPEKYDHIASFLKNGYIDWRQYYNYRIGDVVYVYASKGMHRIIAKCEVVKIDMNKKDITDDSEYWKMKEYDNTGINRFFRLKLIQLVNTKNLYLNDLRQHGLNRPPQGACRIKGELVRYIEEQI